MTVVLYCLTTGDHMSDVEMFNKSFKSLLSFTTGASDMSNDP